MHHIKGNLYAERLNERGDVRLLKLTSQTGTRDINFDEPIPPHMVAVDMLLDAAQFARLVVCVSARGDDYDHTHYYQILANHNRPVPMNRRFLEAIVGAYIEKGEHSKARKVEHLKDGELQAALEMLIADYTAK